MAVIRDENNGQGEEDRGPDIFKKPTPVALKHPLWKMVLGLVLDSGNFVKILGISFHDC